MPDTKPIVNPEKSAQAITPFVTPQFRGFGDPNKVFEKEVWADGKLSAMPVYHDEYAKTDFAFDEKSNKVFMYNNSSKQWDVAGTPSKADLDYYQFSRKAFADPYTKTGITAQTQQYDKSTNPVNASRVFKPSDWFKYYDAAKLQNGLKQQEVEFSDPYSDKIIRKKADVFNVNGKETFIDQATKAVYSKIPVRTLNTDNNTYGEPTYTEKVRWEKVKDISDLDIIAANAGIKAKTGDGYWTNLAEKADPWMLNYVSPKIAQNVDYDTKAKLIRDEIKKQYNTGSAEDIKRQASTLNDDNQSKFFENPINLAKALVGDKPISDEIKANLVEYLSLLKAKGDFADTKVFTTTGLLDSQFTYNQLVVKAKSGGDDIAGMKLLLGATALAQDKLAYSNAAYKTENKKEIVEAYNKIAAQQPYADSYEKLNSFYKQHLKMGDLSGANKIRPTLNALAEKANQYTLTPKEQELAKQYENLQKDVDEKYKTLFDTVKTVYPQTYNSKEKEEAYKFGIKTWLNNLDPVSKYEVATTMSMASGLTAGTLGLGSAALHMASNKNKYDTLDVIAEHLDDITKTADNYLQPHFENDKLMGWMQSAGYSIGMMAPAIFMTGGVGMLGTRLGASAATLNTASKITQFVGTYGSIYQDYYSKAREQGLSERESVSFANTSAAINSVLELFIPLERLTNPASKMLFNMDGKVFSKMLANPDATLRRSVMKSTLLGGLETLAGENIEEYTQNIADYLIQRRYNGEKLAHFEQQSDMYNADTFMSVLLTTALMGVGGIKHTNINRKESENWAYNFLSSNFSDFKDTYNELGKKGAITPEMVGHYENISSLHALNHYLSQKDYKEYFKQLADLKAKGTITEDEEKDLRLKYARYVDVYTSDINNNSTNSVKLLLLDKQRRNAERTENFVEAGQAQTNILDMFNNFASEQKTNKTSENIWNYADNLFADIQTGFNERDELRKQEGKEEEATKQHKKVVEKINENFHVIETVFGEDLFTEKGEETTINLKELKKRIDEYLDKKVGVKPEEVTPVGSEIPKTPEETPTPEDTKKSKDTAKPKEPVQQEFPKSTDKSKPFEERLRTLYPYENRAKLKEDYNNIVKNFGALEEGEEIDDTDDIGLNWKIDTIASLMEEYAKKEKESKTNTSEDTTDEKGIDGYSLHQTAHTLGKSVKLYGVKTTEDGKTSMREISVDEKAKKFVLGEEIPEKETQKISPTLVRFDNSTNVRGTKERITTDSNDDVTDTSLHFTNYSTVENAEEELQKELFLHPEKIADKITVETSYEVAEHNAKALGKIIETPKVDVAQLIKFNYILLSKDKLKFVSTTPGAKVIAIRRNTNRDVFFRIKAGKKTITLELDYQNKYVVIENENGKLVQKAFSFKNSNLKEVNQLFGLYEKVDGQENFITQKQLDQLIENEAKLKKIYSLIKDGTHKLSDIKGLSALVNISSIDNSYSSTSLAQAFKLNPKAWNNEGQGLHVVYKSVDGGEIDEISEDRGFTDVKTSKNKGFYVRFTRLDGKPFYVQAFNKSPLNKETQDKIISLLKEVYSKVAIISKDNKKLDADKDNERQQLLEAAIKELNELAYIWAPKVNKGKVTNSYLKFVVKFQGKVPRIALEYPAYKEEGDTKHVVAPFIEIPDFNNKKTSFEDLLSTMSKNIGVKITDKNFREQLPKNKKFTDEELLAKLDINTRPWVIKTKITIDTPAAPSEEIAPVKKEVKKPKAEKTPVKKESDTEKKEQEELSQQTDAGYSTIALDYLFTGGRDVILSTDYLLQALVGGFTSAAKEINNIRNKYSNKIGNIKDDINSDVYNQMMSEIRNVINKNYNDSKANEIFDKILKNATGFTFKEGIQVSGDLETLNEQNESKINNEKIKKLKEKTPVVIEEDDSENSVENVATGADEGDSYSAVESNGEDLIIDDENYSAKEVKNPPRIVFPESKKEEKPVEVNPELQDLKNKLAEVETQLAELNTKEKTPENVKSIKELFLQKARLGTKIKSFNKGVFRLDDGNSLNTSIITKAEIEAIKKQLPKSVSIRMDRVMNKLNNDSIPLGYFLNNCVYLSKVAKKGTGYHEVFHAVFRTILSDEEIDKYLRLEKANILATNPKAFSEETVKEFIRKRQYDVSTQEAIDLIIEESLADGYMNFSLKKEETKKYSVKAIFNTIKDFISQLFKNDGIKSLYSNIYKGKYVNATIKGNKFNNIGYPLYSILKAYDGKIGGNVKSNNLINLITAKVATTFTEISEDEFTTADIKEVIDELIQKENDYLDYIINNPFSEEETAFLIEESSKVLEALQDDEEQIYAEVTKRLKKYGYKPENKTLYEIEDEYDVHIHDRAIDEVFKNFDDIGRDVKMFFSSIVYIEKNEFGREEEKTVDSYNLYNYFLRLSNLIGTEDFVSKLEELGETNNELKAFVKAFKKYTGYTAENHNMFYDFSLTNAENNPELVKGISFYHRFLDLIDKIYVTHNTVILDGDKTKVIETNRDKPADMLFSKWQSAYKEKEHRIDRQTFANNLSALMLGFPKLNDSRAKLVVTKNKIRTEIFDKEEKIQFLKDFLSSIGIDVSYEYLKYSVGKDEYPDAPKLTPEILGSFNMLSEKDASLFVEGKKDINSKIKTIAQGNAFFDASVFQTSFKTPDGKIRNSYVLPNYILTETKQLREEYGTSQTEAVVKDSKKNSREYEAVKTKTEDAYFSKNPLFNPKLYTVNGKLDINQIIKAFTNIEATLAGGVRNAYDIVNRGVDFKDTDSKTLLTTLLNLFQDIKTKDGVKLTRYQTQQMEAASSLYAIMLPYKENLYDEKTNKFSETAINVLYDMFLQEVDRINGKFYVDKDGNISTVGDETKSNLSTICKNKLFANFRFLNEDLEKQGVLQVERDDKGKPISSSVDEKKLKESEASIKQLIQKYFVEDLEKYRETLDKKGVITYSYGQYSSGYVHLKGFKSYKELTGNYYINDFIFSAAYNQLMYGDLAIAKNDEEVTKRYKGPNAYGNNFSGLDVHVMRTTEPTHKNAFLNSEVNPNDAQGEITALFQFKKFLRKGLIKNERQVEIWRQLIDGVKDVEEFIDLQNELGYSVVDGIKLAKTIYYGELDYIKMSEAVLFPNFTSYWDEKTQSWKAQEGLEYLHNKRLYMEKHGVDLAIPLSASKRVNIYSALNDEMFKKENFDPAKFLGEKPIHTPHKLSGDHYRLQVETESHGWGENVSTPTQGFQITQAELKEDKNPLKELANLKLAQIKKQAYEKLMSDVEKETEDLDGTQRAYIAPLLKRMRESVETSTPDPVLLEFLQQDEHGDMKYSFNLPQVTAKLATLYYNFFAKTNAPRFTGKTAILRSGHGFNIKYLKEDKTETPVNTLTYLRDENKDKYTSRPLRVHQFKNGEPSYAEIVMPLGLLKTIGLKVGDEIPEEVLKGLGMRIPTQSHHSLTFFKIVDTLPEFMGDIVIVPEEIIGLSGADFDVDKLIMLLKTFYKNKEGKAIIYGKDTDGSAESRFEEYKQYTLNTNVDIKTDIREKLDTSEKYLTLLVATKKLRDNKTELYKQIRRINDLLDEGELSKEARESAFESKSDLYEKKKDIQKDIDKLVKKTAEIKREIEDDVFEEKAFYKLSDFERDKELKCIGALQNEFLDVLLQLGTSPELEESYKTPATMTIIDKIGRKIYQELADKSTEGHLINSVNGKLEAFENTTAGKRLVGPHAVTNIVGIYLEKNNVKLKPTYYGKSVDYGVHLNGKNHDSFSNLTEEDVDIDFDNVKKAVEEAIKKGVLNKDISFIKDKKIVRRINDSISSFVSAATDNVKNLGMKILGHTMDTAGAWGVAIKLGMGQVDTNLLSMSPVMQELQSKFDEINGYLATATAKKTSITEKFLKDTFDKLPESTKENLKGNSELLNSLTSEEIIKSFIYARMKKLSPEQQADKDFIDYRILHTFKKLDNLSAYFIKLSSVLALNKKIESDQNVFENTLRNYEELLEEESPFDIKEAFENDINVQQSMKAVKSALEESKRFFLRNSNFIVDNIKKLEDIFEKEYYKNAYLPKVKEMFSDFLITKVIKKYSVNNGIDENIILTMPNKFESMLEKYPELRKNEFINNLQVKEADERSKTPRTLVTKNNINSTIFTERMVDSYSVLLQNEDSPEIVQFAKEMFYYLLYKDGLKYKFFSYVKYLKPEAFEEVARRMKELTFGLSIGIPMKDLIGITEEEAFFEFKKQFAAFSNWDQIGEDKYMFKMGSVFSGKVKDVIIKKMSFNKNVFPELKGISEVTIKDNKVVFHTRVLTKEEKEKYFGQTQVEFFKTETKRFKIGPKKYITEQHYIPHQIMKFHDFSIYLPEYKKAALVLKSVKVDGEFSTFEYEVVPAFYVNFMSPMTAPIEFYKKNEEALYNVGMPTGDQWDGFDLNDVVDDGDYTRNYSDDIDDDGTYDSSETNEPIVEEEEKQEQITREQKINLSEEQKTFAMKNVIEQNFFDGKYYKHNEQWKVYRLNDDSKSAMEASIKGTRTETTRSVSQQKELLNIAKSQGIENGVLGTIVYMKDLGEKSPTRGLSGWFKITSEFYTPNKEDFNKYENWKPYIWEDRKEDFNIGGKNEWKSVRFEYINDETNFDASIDTNTDTNLNDEDEFYKVKDNVVQARIIFPKTNEDEEGKKLEDDCNIK